METFNAAMRVISMISAGLMAIWLIALMIGAYKQVSQIRLDWMHGRPFTIPNNPVLDYALTKLRLQYCDRLTCIFGLLSMILAWPLTLVFGYPVISMISARYFEQDSSAR
jgi:hypothetical protein